ncbi:MAG: right-handed parallel beta-helix repeat-containing protein, partial [Spirochaetia bacterium]|nr:right-handed parallel beta-helix repeat-containing protein [Spirochaetia bacterium]
MTKLPTCAANRKRFLLAFVVLIFHASLLGAATFYVAPNGNDAWSGTLAAPNSAKTDGPFLSPPRARDALRESKKKNASGPFVVELREGTYPLSETLVFRAEDSDSIWRAYGSERPVLSGGRVISGFQEAVVNGKKRWQTVLPEAKSGAWYFRQLFVSTKGQPWERRYRPNLGMKRVDGLTYSPRRKAASHRAAQIDFIFAPGDFKKWENLNDVEVVLLHVWSSSRLLVKEVDALRNVVTFTGMPTFAVDQGGLQPYFIENVKEELDASGEWYLDRPTGLLSYIPKDGESLADSRVIAPVLSTVVSLNANYSNESFVAHFVMSNLVFSHNESALPKEGYGGSQAQPDLPSAVELVGAKECEFSRCVISQTGNYGIGIGLGCHSNRVVGCRMFDLGGGGVKVGDIQMNGINKNAKYPMLPTGNRVENCAISDGGVMYFSANAVWGGLVNGAVIAHNEIYNFPYAGMAVGWSWSDEKTSCASNRMEYNLVSNVLTLLADGASIYTLGRQPGTVIRGNVVRDNVQSVHAKFHWQLGLYLDEGSSEML